MDAILIAINQFEVPILSQVTEIALLEEVRLHTKSWVLLNVFVWGGGEYSLQDQGLKILMCCIVSLHRVVLSLKAYV